MHFHRKHPRQIVCLPSDKGTSLNKKEFAPLGSKFFPSRVDPFWEDSGVRESKQ